MTHRQVLMHELAQHGRTTYRELLEKWGSRGYTYRGFLGAVWRSEKRGEVRGPGSGVRGGYIVKTCPCCKRPL